MYKPSRYNHYYKNMIFNAVSGAIGIYSEQELEAIKNCSKDMPMKLMEEALSNGFIIDKSIDEINRVVYSRRVNMYSLDKNNRMGITIAPTSACNARCFYCYEKGIRFIDMTPDIAEKATALIESKIEGKKSLKITWYGGEPLLCPDVISLISGRLIRFCKDRDIEYSASMYTNGSMLRKNLHHLKEWAITSIQIPIDGYGEEYAIRKAYVSSPCTYDDIKKVAKEVMELGVHVGFRLNLDRNNMDSQIDAAKDLVETFHGLDKFKIYAAMITGYNKSICYFDRDEYTEKFNKFYSELDKAMPRKRFMTPPSLTGCYATRSDSFVIGPDGSLYKCQHCLGNESQKVGDVDIGLIGNRCYYQWCSAELPNVCKECDILPLCMGGCFYEHLVNRNSKSACNSVRYQFRYDLETAYNHFLKIGDDDESC